MNPVRNEKFKILTNVYVSGISNGMKVFLKRRTAPRGPASPRRTSRGGFTLIEMLVSVAIFTIVMVVALGALLSITESDRKAQTLKSVINNLNFALDSMSRTIRTGTQYHCGSTGTITAPQDCSTPNSFLSFLAADGRQLSYRLVTNDTTNCPGSGSCLQRATNGASGSPTFETITSPEVYITRADFYVKGAAASPDLIQPKITILLSGFVQVGGGATAVSQCNQSTGGTVSVTCSIFNLETSVTQRIYDQ